MCAIATCPFLFFQKALHLNNNDFSGPLPYSFCLCGQLTSLVVSHTQIQVSMK